MALAAVVEVRDERAERERDAREEQEQSLAGAQHRSVNTDAVGAHRSEPGVERRDDEEVGEEQQLGEQGPRRAERPEPEQRPVRSSGMPMPSSRAGSRRRSRVHPATAIASATAHDAP